MKVILQNAVAPDSHDARVNVFNYETNPDWIVKDANGSLCSKACLALNFCLGTYMKGQENSTKAAVAIDSFGVFLMGVDISSLKSELLNRTFTTESFRFQLKASYQKDLANTEYIKATIVVSGQIGPGDARTFEYEVIPGIENPHIEVPILDYYFNLNNDSQSTSLLVNTFYICDNTGNGVEFSFDNGNYRVYEAEGLLDFKDDAMKGHCIDIFKDNDIASQIEIMKIADRISKLSNDSSSYFVSR